MSDQFLSLGEIAQFINGAAFKPEDWGSEGLPIIRIQNLTDPTKSFNRTTRSIAPKLHVQPGDLLVSWSATLGVFVWERPEIALLNQHIFRVLPDENLVDKTYLRHALSGALLAMQKHLHGATMQHVNRGEFLATPVFLPPLPEQRRIAAILDQADTLRTQRRAALAQLDSLTQSLFLDMFGDPEVNEKRLPVCSLSSLCNRVTDGTHQSPRWETSGVPFLFISNIVKGQITFETHKYISSETYSELTKRCPIEVGDILYTTVGSYGNAAVVATNERFAFQRHIAHIKPDANKVDPLFLAAMIQSVGVRRQVDKVAKGVAQKTVNLADLKSLQVFAPPLPLQQTFATRVQAIEALKAQHRAALATQDALFASLQQRAFAGAL